MNLYKVTAVANVAGVLLTTMSRAGGRIQNPFSVPIWLDVQSNPAYGPPSICVPAANAAGPGEYIFDDQPYQDWWYKTAASGDFAMQTW